MSAKEFLERVKAEAATTGVIDWRQVREDIHDEFDAAQNDAERDALLGVFVAVMDNVERNANLGADDLEAFKKTRAKDYNLFIVKESLIGENVSVEIIDAVTKREMAAGRMGPEHELRQLAVKGLSEPFMTKAELLMTGMAKHREEVLSQQGAGVRSGNFDFMPQFLTRATNMFVLGALWRFGEKYPVFEPKDAASIGLIKCLIDDGMKADEAKETGAELSLSALNADGKMHPIVWAGYEAGTRAGALAEVLGQFRHVPEVSGAPYRMLDRAKPISLIVGVASALVAMLFGRDFWTGIGIGIVVGGASIAIALAIYRGMVKRG
jgi:hypothetical protein